MSRLCWILLLLSGACTDDAPVPGVSSGDPQSGASGTGESPECPVGTVRDDDGTCQELPASELCPEGFKPLAGNAGCEAILPAGGCPAGTREAIGSETCVPVGWLECPAGFKAAEGGRGCDPILPSVSCEGATMERLGSTDCVPVGDCSTSFPPGLATMYVSKRFEPNDPTHFDTLSKAIAAAPDGAVIAVYPGTYVETISIERPVTLVGQCAELVILENPGNEDAGVEIRDTEGVEIRGLTVRGHWAGIEVWGSSLDLRETVVEANHVAGIVASDPGTILHAEDVVVRDTGGGSDPDLQRFGVFGQNGADIQLTRVSAVGNTYANILVSGLPTALSAEGLISSKAVPPSSGIDEGARGLGIRIAEGASAVIAGSAVLDNHEDGVLIDGADAATNAPSTADISTSVVRGTKWATVTTELGARGIEVLDRAEATVRECAIGLNLQTNIMVLDGARVRLEDSNVHGAPGDVSSGNGIRVKGATLEVLRSAVVHGRFFGVSAQDSADVTLEDSAVSDSLPALDPFAPGDPLFGMGVVVLDSKATIRTSSVSRSRSHGVFLDGAPSDVRLDRAVVSDTAPDENGLFGWGILQQGGRMHVERSAVLRNIEAGIGLFQKEGDASIVDTTVGPTTAGGSSGFGMGILLFGDVHAAIDGSTVHDSDSFGLVVSAASAEFDGGFISNNQVGVHTQAGTTVLDGAGAQPGPLTLVVSPETAFVGNQIRVGGATDVPTPTEVINPEE